MTTRTLRIAARRHGRRRTGLALAAVILAMLGVGVLLTTAFAVVIPDHRATRARWAAHRALQAAGSTVATPEGRTPFPWLEAGDSIVVALSLPDGARAQLTRIVLAPPFITTRVVAEAAGQGSVATARAQATALGRRALAAPLPTAALLAIGTVTLDSGVVLSGAPIAPPAWSGCPPDARSAALRMVDSAQLIGSAQAILVGAPAIGAAIARATADSIDRTVTALLRTVTLRLAVDEANPAPAEQHGRCELSSHNWGEASRSVGAVWPCRGYAPVVHVTPPSGTLRIDAPSRSQGTVVVDGNLALRASMDVLGILVVRGTVDATAAPIRVQGTLLALGSVALGRGSRVAFAQCAMEGAQLAAAAVAPIGNGGWLQP
jgi:hypothetical protein